MKLKTIQMKRTIRNAFITIGFLVINSLIPQIINPVNSKIATIVPRTEIKILVMFCGNVNMLTLPFKLFQVLSDNKMISEKLMFVHASF